MPEKINWTAEQTAAINAKGRAVLVSAAAGSGKTAVLVERLTRLLTDINDPVPADSIVVVTFTKDAAAQMKDKLTNALNERLADGDTSEEEAEYISNQLSLLPSADISTIHSYCFRLIRENAGLAGVDPAFAVADGEDSKDIILKAAQEAYEELIKNSPEKMKLLTDFFCGGERNINKLTDTLLELRDKFLALPFPRDIMDGIVKYFKDNAEELSPGEGVTGEYLKLARRRMKNAADAADCLYAYLADVKKNLPAYCKEDKKLLDNISAAAEVVAGDSSLLKKLSDNLERETEEIFSEKTNACSLFDPPVPIEAGKRKTDKKGNVSCSVQKIPAVKYERDGVEIDESAKIKNVRKLYYAAVSDFYEFKNSGASAPAGTPMRFTSEQIKSDFKMHARMTEVLFEALKALMDKERELKARANLLGFSDALQIACGILCKKEGDIITPSETAKTISENTSLVLIDEFQDSSRIQELIFRMISKGGDSKTPGSNFFAVGDVKQSIYRFNSAEPELFVKNLKNSVPYDGEGDSPSHILLRRNFRCRM
ncbi:MAG: UvrD-helicase domain-containing protein, partial [Ruminococcus sp.]|nr:UvrD-helicase domain-containing protein [Ruminococcus sp.]